MVSRNRASRATPTFPRGADEPTSRHGPDVLASGGRHDLPPVQLVGFDHDLGVERAKGARERHDVDDGWLSIQDPWAVTTTAG